MTIDVLGILMHSWSRALDVEWLDHSLGGMLIFEEFWLPPGPFKDDFFAKENSTLQPTKTVRS